MEIRLLTSPDDLKTYDTWIRSHPDGSLWQSLEWKKFQESLGREMKIYAVMESDRIVASALVVIDRTRGGMSTWEIPRGPLDVSGFGFRVSGLLEKILIDAKKDKTISLFLSPSSLISRNQQPATRNPQRFVMPETTRILNLTLSETDLLTQMRPKGRYNIRLAEKHGVQVTQSDDIAAYTALATDTAKRDGFRGHSMAFYKHFLKDLPGSFLLLATHEKKTLAGLLGVIWGTKGLPAEAGAAAPAKVGIYYYGASSNIHRELMAPYLLQWEAMRICRKQGCTSYDLFGIAPEGKDDHPWSSVSDFKAKFGGEIVTYSQEQEIILRPFAKKLIQIKRRFIG